jgi:hypothetical protein
MKSKDFMDKDVFALDEKIGKIKEKQPASKHLNGL